jgi:nitroimidazol reductase NimA-like FMN-containing flavoprotein (pyridoxamine 5'-phosphate oxidase superfamily)
MSAQERELFLAAPHVGVMSINRLHSTAPLATPVWYNYAAGGEVTVQIQRTSLKYQLLGESGAFTLTVQDEEYPYGYVSVSGDATFDESLGRDDVYALAKRYLSDADATAYAHGNVDASITVFVRMRPRLWFGQDFSKT